MQIDIANYSELMIRQRVERLEAITGFETANRYTVMTPQGDELLHAQEESSTLSRIFLRSHRPLTLRVSDRSGNDLLVASRSFSGSSPISTSAIRQADTSVRSGAGSRFHHGSSQSRVPAGNR